MAVAIKHRASAERSWGHRPPPTQYCTSYEDCLRLAVIKYYRQHLFPLSFRCEWNTRPIGRHPSQQQQSIFFSSCHLRSTSPVLVRLEDAERSDHQTSRAEWE